MHFELEDILRQADVGKCSPDRRTQLARTSCRRRHPRKTQMAPPGNFGLGHRVGAHNSRYARNPGLCPMCVAVGSDVFVERPYVTYT